MVTIPVADEVTLAALEDAHTLVRLGVPVFTCKLDRDGEPIPPGKWQTTRPDEALVKQWKPGLGLCAVTGIKFDVIDIDPRNGGLASFDKLSESLGENGPEVYRRYDTRGGGMHLWIAPLGIGSHGNFMPGIDLKGGKPDGEGRGFVFIPPTVRPFNGAPAPYRDRKRLRVVRGDGNPDPIRSEIERRLASRGLNGNAPPREDSSSLMTAVMKAEAGEQRSALLRYVHELERKGYADGDIVRLCMALNLTAFDPDRPWTRKDFRSLLHKPGKVIPDATPSEAALLTQLRPLTAGLVRPVSELKTEIVRWLWPGYIAFREFTLLDGEKGVGKSFIVDWLAAVASLGSGFPCCEEVTSEPIKVIIFTDEGHMESVTLPRLNAAGADLTRVFIPRIQVPKPGQKRPDWDMGLPEGAEGIKRRILEADAKLAIFDPITDFLGEGIRPHEDASVRRALRPLALLLDETGCAGFGIRHMNKDTKAAAKYRGAGSMAFQNRARVHLVAREIPGTAKMAGAEGDYALAMVDSNLAKKQKGAITYSIVDSEIPMDTLGNMIGLPEFHGYADVNVLDDIEHRKGPKPSPDRDMAVEILEAMFTEKDTWPEKVVKKELENAGIRISRPTLDKVRNELGIRSARAMKRGQLGGVSNWNWTTRKARIGE